MARLKSQAHKFAGYLLLSWNMTATDTKANEAGIGRAAAFGPGRDVSELYHLVRSYDVIGKS